MVGTVTYEHYNGQKSLSLLENLQLRNDWLDAAIEKCTASDMPAAILEAVRDVIIGSGAGHGRSARCNL